MTALPGRGVRAGIIGTGFMGSVHAEAVRAAGGTVVAVAGRTAEGAADAVERLGAAAASPSPEALIERDDVDVVHICTPNSTHVELVSHVLRQGKAVVCEKPLATTTADSDALTALAREAGVVATVPFVYRFYPAVREARGRIQQGEAGRLWLLHGCYLQDWLIDHEATDWRVDPVRGGASRAFGDIGVHWCDLMEFVTGHRITRVAARTSRAFETRGPGGAAQPVDTEDGAVLLFETDGGAIGSLVVSQVTPGSQNRLWFSLDGTKAAFEFDQQRPEALRIGGAGGSSRIPVGAATLSTPEGRRYARLPAGHPQGYQDAFNAFVGSTYTAIGGEDVEGLPTFDAGARAARLVDAVLRSSSTDAWASIGDHTTERLDEEGQH